MGKLFGIVSQKIITNDKIDRLKKKIIYNNLRENSIFKSNDKKIFLYNKDLCVVNSSKLNQDNNLIVIVIDGEIYNCNEMIKDLTNEGHKFKNYTESEVIACGYEEYGDLIFSKLNGAFSIISFNSDEKINSLSL